MSAPHNSYFRTLTIAGSDSGGGAGIQADLKTFAANGCYGMSVITAITAQNTQGVRAVHPVPPEIVLAQMEAVLSDIGADAVKIGMLFSRELIQAVAQGLRRWVLPAGIPVVLDPVMVAQSGDSLSQSEAVLALKEELIPLATLLTPNLPEAEILLGRSISQDEMATAAQELCQLGCGQVLLKGGHLDGDQCIDVLASPTASKIFTAPRLATRNNHGTGCTLSSAIAAALAKGLDLGEAVAQGRDYLQQALAAGANKQLGQGHGPVHHYHAFFP